MLTHSCDRRWRKVRRRLARRTPKLSFGTIAHDFLEGTRIVRCTANPATDTPSRLLTVRLVHAAARPEAERFGQVEAPWLRLHNPTNLSVTDLTGNVFEKGEAYRVQVEFEFEDDPLGSWVFTATPMKERDGLDKKPATGSADAKKCKPSKRPHT